MRLFKKLVIIFESEDEMFRIETILEQFGVVYESSGADKSGEGTIETYSECPDECLDMLTHCI